MKYSKMAGKNVQTRRIGVIGIAAWASMATSGQAATLDVEAGISVADRSMQVTRAPRRADIAPWICTNALTGCDGTAKFSAFDLDKAQAAGRALVERVLEAGSLGSFKADPEPSHK